VIFPYKGVLCLYCGVMYFRIILRVTGDVKTLNTESTPNFPTRDNKVCLISFISIFHNKDARGDDGDL